MATHSSTLAWKIPWIEERGKLQSMGVTKSQTRLSDFTFNFTSCYQNASQMVLVVKNPAANSGDIRDTGLIPGLETSPGGGHGTAFYYSSLENPTDRAPW